MKHNPIVFLMQRLKTRRAARRQPDPVDHGQTRQPDPQPGSNINTDNEGCCRDGTTDDQPLRVVRFPDLVRIGAGTRHRLYEGLDPGEGPSLGLFVATYAPAEVTELVEVTLLLPGLDQPCVARGRVEWVRPWDPGVVDSHPGMGIRLERCCEQIRSVMLRALSYSNPILFEV